jgi:hypothetical protein
MYTETRAPSASAKYLRIPVLVPRKVGEIIDADSLFKIRNR